MWKMLLKQVLTAGVPWALRKVFGRRGFDYIGIELSEEYCEIARRRVAHTERSLF